MVRNDALYCRMPSDLYLPSHVSKASNNYTYTEGGGDPSSSCGLVYRQQTPTSAGYLKFPWGIWIPFDLPIFNFRCLGVISFGTDR